MTDDAAPAVQQQDECERWDWRGGFCIEGTDCSCRSIPAVQQQPPPGEAGGIGGSGATGATTIVRPDASSPVSPGGVSARNDIHLPAGTADAQTGHNRGDTAALIERLDEWATDLDKREPLMGGGTKRAALLREAAAALAALTEPDQGAGHSAHPGETASAPGSVSAASPAPPAAPPDANVAVIRDALGAIPWFADTIPRKRAALMALDALAAERDRLAAALADAREALAHADEALERHAEWCGYNKDAPGDGSFNRARRSITDALAGKPVSRTRPLLDEEWAEIMAEHAVVDEARELSRTAGAINTLRDLDRALAKYDAARDASFRARAALAGSSDERQETVAARAPAGETTVDD